MADELSFTVEQWNADASRLEAVIARASNQLVARGAFDVAARLYPRNVVMLRQRARVIETTEKDRKR